MQLQNIASSLMEPSDQHDILACVDPLQSIRDSRNYFDPSLRRSLASLLRCLGPMFEAGSYEANRGY
jgi:hypothetical protein